MKTKDRLFGNFVVIGGPVSCHYDNLYNYVFINKYQYRDEVIRIHNWKPSEA